MYEFFKKHMSNILQDRPTFVIAEAGVNHNGSLEMAMKLVDTASEAGADAVKFQTFKADNLLSKNAPKAKYQLQTTDNKESQHEMLRKLELSEDEFEELFAYCKSKNICFISTPFDGPSVDFLEELGVEIYKIASSEITNLPLLEQIAKKGKSIILSTGMSTLAEVAMAVEVIEEHNPDLSLLHCVSNYPADYEDVNLNVIKTLKSAFAPITIGYSDHTKGIEAVLAAVAMGATIVEKHFTLDKGLEGPDHRASLEPEELAQMVKSIRVVEQCLGTSRKIRTKNEESPAQTMRKSLVAAEDLSAGSVLSRKHIDIKRPGTGIPPSRLDDLIGLVVQADIKKDELLSWDLF